MLMDLLVSSDDDTPNYSQYIYVLCIGQFLTADVKIDTENMLMKLGDRNPFSVKRDKVWPHVGINAECWYGAATNNQGAGIIDGIYTDYIVDHLIPKQKQNTQHARNHSIHLV